MRPSVRRIISLLLVFLLVFGMVPQALATSGETDSSAVTTPTDPPVDDNDSKPPETTSSSDETVPGDITTEAVIPDTTVPSETLPPEEPVSSTPSDTTTPSSESGSGSDSTTAATTPPTESEPTDTTPPDTSDSTTVATTAPPSPSESTATTTPPSETLPPEEPDVTKPTTEPDTTTPNITEPATVPDETVPVTEPEEEVYWLDAIDKGESALNVVYDEFFTEEQLAQMPSVMAAAVRATHGSHRQACNIWLSGKRLSYTFEGVSRTVDSVVLHRVYDSNTGSWNVAFCLEPGVPNASSGYVDNQLSAEATWGNLSREQQAVIGLAILYGAPNNPELKTSDTRRMLAYELATYVIIQEVCLGWRNTSAPYACNNPAYINAFGKGNLEITSGYYPEVDGMYLRTSAWTSGEADEVMDAYNYISSKMAIHDTIPSFTSDRLALAPTHPLTQSGSKWTTTLTDTNNILSEYKFSNTSALTFSVSGNKLTVTAAGKGPYTAIAPTRTVPNITASGSLFRIWKTSSGAQEIITCASPRNDPVPAYFNLGPTTGAIKGTKSTEDGVNLDGWTIQLKSGNTVIATTTTDSKGNFSFTDIPAGTYTLHEEISSSSKYVCVNNDQTVTVTAGDTVSVTVKNDLKRGNMLPFISFPSLLLISK